MSYGKLHEVQIENEDLFELKAWLQDMRATKNLYATLNSRSDCEAILDIRLAIFERIMKQLP